MKNRYILFHKIKKDILQHKKNHHPYGFCHSFLEDNNSTRTDLSKVFPELTPFIPYRTFLGVDTSTNQFGYIWNSTDYQTRLKIINTIIREHKPSLKDKWSLLLWKLFNKKVS